jgi:hypothetical protein
MFRSKHPECGSDEKDASKEPSCCGIQSRDKKIFFGRKSIWSFCIFNILMFIWVINITNYLSDPKLAADIVGADRFGLALIIAAWITCDILAGLAALISMFVRRKY